MTESNKDGPVTYKGYARGRLIELEESLPYPEGQVLNISVLPAESAAAPPTTERLRQAMRDPPHLSSQDVDELESAIAAGKLGVNDDGVFDVGP